jgi:vancomycin resistance protein YoaR
MKLRTRIIFASVATVILLLGAVSYVRDQSSTPDTVARNVTVGDVAVGGLNTADATLALSAHENALLSGVGVFTVNGSEFRLSPASIELDVDVSAGVDAAMQARRSGTIFETVRSWFTSFVTTESVALPISFNDEVIAAELEIWESIVVERPAFDGSITVDDGEVVTRYPLPGVGVNRETGTALIRSAMSSVGTAPTVIPVVSASSPLSDDQIDAAAAEMRQMINDAVVLRSDDATFRMTFTERQLASAVRATIDPASDSIEVYFDRDAVLDILEPLRREFEISPIDARFDIDLNTGEYTVIPGRSGVVLDVETLLTELESAAHGSGTGVFPVVVGAKPQLTTEEAMAFTTMTKLGGFSTKYTQGQDRTRNIQQMSEDVDGAIVRAGEVFSINDHVGQRIEARGYVAAPAIINGAPYCCDHPTNIGGGVSQFATTLFNAVFFSCLEDVEHQPHSLYFTRYPRGREATLGVPGPDVKFRNDTDFPVVIRSWYTAESISVRIYGFNGGLECESNTHDKQNIVAFEKEFVADPDIAPGQQRKERSGIDGFLQRVDRIVTFPDDSTEEDLHLVWRYRPLSELWSVNPCEASGEPVNCPFTLGSVIGSSWETALDTLANQGLKAAQVLESVNDPGKDNIVIDQNPSRGTPVRQGATITLTVGTYAGDSDG